MLLPAGPLAQEVSLQPLHPHLERPGPVSPWRWTPTGRSFRNQHHLSLTPNRQVFLEPRPEPRSPAPLGSMVHTAPFSEKLTKAR